MSMYEDKKQGKTEKGNTEKGRTRRGSKDTRTKEKGAQPQREAGNRRLQIGEGSVK